MKKLLSTLGADELFALSRSFRSDFDGESEEASAESEYKRGGKRMSERYLCRGKRIDNGEWVYGYYVRTRKQRHHIYENVFGYDTDIDPKTLGENTGLRDKNGVLIYEGDIVRASVKGKIGIEPICFDHAMWCLGDGEMSDPLADLMDIELEIIGNIHDNPELLENGVSGE